MLLRDFPLTLLAMEERILITCSLPIVPSTAGGVGGTGISSTGNSIVSSCSGSTGGYQGRIIDRRGEELTSRYHVAIPQAFLMSTVGSTEANRNLTLGIALTHGDSSGGGDQAVYSCANQPAARNFFSSVRVSDQQAWTTAGAYPFASTGPFIGATLPNYYDLRAAKRYLSVVVFASKNKVTTESSGDEGARVHATITFAAGDEVPQNVATTTPWSSSTST